MFFSRIWALDLLVSIFYLTEPSPLFILVRLSLLECFLRWPGGRSCWMCWLTPSVRTSFPLARTLFLHNLCSCATPTLDMSCWMCWLTPSVRTSFPLARTLFLHNLCSCATPTLDMSCWMCWLTPSVRTSFPLARTLFLPNLCSCAAPTMARTCWMCWLTPSVQTSFLLARSARCLCTLASMVPWLANLWTSSLATYPTLSVSNFSPYNWHNFYKQKWYRCTWGLNNLFYYWDMLMKYLLSGNYFLLHIIFAYNQRDGEYNISRGHYLRGWIE